MTPPDAPPSTPFELTDHRRPFTIVFDGLPFPSHPDGEWAEMLRDAQTGDLNACYYLVIWLSERGEGELANHYAQHMIDAGSIGALHGRADVNHGRDEAVPDLLALAALGDTHAWCRAFAGDACLSLGDHYETLADASTAGTTEQLLLQATAVDWHKRAAAFGMHEGYLTVGYAYEHGWGVPRDLVEATSWYCAVIRAPGDPDGLRYDPEAFPVDTEGRWWDHERLGRFLANVDAEAAAKIRALVVALDKARQAAHASNADAPGSHMGGATSLLDSK
jgi:hypothetical protein